MEKRRRDKVVLFLQDKAPAYMSIALQIIDEIRFESVDRPRYSLDSVPSKTLKKNFKKNILKVKDFRQMTKS